MMPILISFAAFFDATSAPVKSPDSKAGLTFPPSMKAKIPQIIPTNPPSGELHPVVFHDPPCWPRTSKKLALIAIVGALSTCQARSGS